MQIPRPSSKIAMLFGIMVIIAIAHFHCHHSPSESISQAKDSDSALWKSTERTSEQISAAPLLQGVSQDDPALLTYIRSLIVPPSMLPYNLTKPRREHFSQYGQTQFLMDTILPNMTDGFFVEVGALDGEHLSNTLFLERRMGWRGLLIEAIPQTYKQLLHKHRKAYSLQAALSLTNESTQVAFHVRGAKLGLSSVFASKSEKSQKIIVQAFPLYSILKAIDVTVIDYFSLDIEGAELEVLATVPWDKVKIRVMNVEFNHLKGGEKALIHAMTARGMLYIGTRSIDAWFVCPELYKKTRKNLS